MFGNNLNETRANVTTEYYYVADASTQTLDYFMSEDEDRSEVKSERLQYRHNSYPNKFHMPSSNEDERNFSQCPSNRNSVELMQPARDERKDNLYMEYYQQFNQENENYFLKSLRNMISPVLLILILIFIKSFYL